jgi:hypothetical protein
LIGHCFSLSPRAQRFELSSAAVKVYPKVSIFRKLVELCM